MTDENNPLPYARVGEICAKAAEMYRHIGYILCRVHSEEAMKPQAAEWRRELLDKFQCSLDEFTNELLEISKNLAGTVAHRMTFDAISSQLEFVDVAEEDDTKGSTSKGSSRKRTSTRKRESKKGGMKVTDGKSNQRRAMGPDILLLEKPTMIRDEEKSISRPAQSDVEDLEEYLAILSKDNSKRINLAKERRTNCSFFDQRCVEFIFMVCDRFHFSPDVRYSTVCLFDTFMLAHIRSLLQYVDENCRTEESFMKDWNTVETKLSSQIVLRVLSCVQIISKISCYATQLNVSSVKNFLQCMGHCYTEEQILKSELRVLKTLDYDVNVQSPLTYVDILLKLVAADVELFDLQSIYDVCLDILSFVFMKRDDIYDSILLDPISGQERKHQIAVLEVDYMLLACGVITSAVELNRDQCNEHSILLSLSKRSSIAVEEMTHFRANVKKWVIKTKQNIRRQESAHRRSTPSKKHINSIQA
ncbi:hypothetical protein TTRE_0000400501 [Trichuris trichiura]|uniref:Cyclin N-terminal domain-containing protein n=1 Tax=Trichuris trichiura TaxID=36087 RepID=A0A077Z5K7_TRITR|nr:hypothetical protein TTRE_0000400501 [Trichuris trichiura]